MRWLLCLLALVAASGCLDGTDGVPDDPDDPADQGTGDRVIQPGPGADPDTGLHEDVNGTLHLAGKMVYCDVGVCLHLNATNEGAEPLHISNICAPPHSESMERDGEAVSPREPYGSCAAFGTRELAPNESVAFSYEWDQRVYDHDRDEMRPAAVGVYAWTIQFVAFTSVETGDALIARVTFDVAIDAA